jgi:hypothetical protein
MVSTDVARTVARIVLEIVRQFEAGEVQGVTTPLYFASLGQRDLNRLRRRFQDPSRMFRLLLAYENRRQ